VRLGERNTTPHHTTPQPQFKTEGGACENYLPRLFAILECRPNKPDPQSTYLRRCVRVCVRACQEFHILYQHPYCIKQDGATLFHRTLVKSRVHQRGTSGATYHQCDDRDYPQQALWVKRTRAGCVREARCSIPEFKNRRSLCVSARIQ
jgi:hypothetical protein